MDNLLNNFINLYENETIHDNNDTTSTKLITEYNRFKMPIEYHKHKVLSDTVQSDLELLESSIDEDNENETNEDNIKQKHNHKKESIVSNLLSDNENKYPLLRDKMSTVYTTNNKFLKDNQKFVSKYQHTSIPTKIQNFMNEYLDYKCERSFLAKYQYIQFKRLSHLNKSPGVLQILGLYNFCSPLFSLLAPIIGLILPYFVLWFKGIRLSFSSYYLIIKNIVLNNTIINGLMNFHKNSIKKNMYTFASIFIYVMSVYNNVIYCIEYYRNMDYINSYINRYQAFILDGELMLNDLYEQTKKLATFTEFNRTLKEYLYKIENIKERIWFIINDNSKLSKLSQLGLLLKHNYELFNNEEIHDVSMYLIYLSHYLNNISSINKLVRDKKLGKCKLVSTSLKARGGDKKSKSKSKKTTINGMYYLPHIGSYDSTIKNNISIDKNIIITGPNASGKTTCIKSILINLFLSQSLGFGCYESANIVPYDYFHSYLNIPDTSDRDSLFQAEARRCKEIIDFIELPSKCNKRHFAIFDEIYSGTNPRDAVKCATIYLNALNKHHKNVDYILTTHYTDICEKFDKHKYTCNKKMMVNLVDDNTINCLYKIVDGISFIDGGYQILVQLNYSSHILDN